MTRKAGENTQGGAGRRPRELSRSDMGFLMQSTLQCVLVHDAETKEILWANPAACQILGFTVEELKPLKAPDMTSNAHQYARHIGLRWLQDAVEKGTSSIEWCYRSKTGEEILTDAVATRVDLPGRAVVMVQFRDVAEERATRLELFRMAQEHRRDTQYLNHLARYNAMGDMAMAIAHEVGQPIAAAYNYVAGVRSRLGKEGTDPAALRWGLESAARQIDRAARILSSLRQYVVRLEQSEQRTDLNTIVEDCGYFVDLRARQDEATVNWDLADEPLPVRCEAVLIGQVVMNLAFNALEEMAGQPVPRRTITISTRRCGEWAEIAVRDRGRGLSAFPEGQVFDGAFTSKKHGSGIGLALSHRIVTRHHGTLEAAENPPRGACFTVRLPLADELADRQE